MKLLDLTLITLLTSTMISGCVTPASYTEPIARYQKASTVVIENARAQYTLANKRARDAQIDELAKNNKRITFTELENSVLISPEALRVRLEALNVLTKHGELLLALSSSDAADKAKTYAGSLNESIKSLQDAIPKSAGVTGSRSTESLAGPFAELAGKLASLAITHKINKELEQAITDSDQSVDALIDSIEMDMRNLYAAQRSAGVVSRRYAVTTYNCQTIDASCKPPVARYSSTERNKAISEIKASEDQWDNINIMSPTAGFDAMRDAHKELVKYATSSKKPQDFSELIEAIEVFVTRATMVADSIKSIRTAQEQI